ncbi:MAG: hypothetical protein LC808_00250 [Actinobacteria bacterium]|nr:hypothetical protein [Actinomycetota bacterium]
MSGGDGNDKLSGHKGNEILDGGGATTDVVYENHRVSR